MSFVSSGTGGGYVYVTVGPKKYRREHLLIAEKALGKPLPAGAVVHHVNRIRTDNRNSNLVICENEKYHRMLHARQRVVDAGGNPDTEKICGICGKCVPKTEFQKARSHYADGREGAKPLRLASTTRAHIAEEIQQVIIQTRYRDFDFDELKRLHNVPAMGPGRPEFWALRRGKPIEIHTPHYEVGECGSPCFHVVRDPAGEQAYACEHIAEIGD